MKKRHIKQLILSFVSLITLSTITISSVVSCSNNTTTLTTEQNKKQSNTKQNNKLIAKIENILKNKSVSVNGYKNKSVQTILDNENSKQSLQQNIEQTIINKIISSSNNQLLRSEIANNLKIKFSNQSENNTLNNKGEIPVTVYYDGQSLGVFNVQGFSSPLLPVEQQTPSISFSNQQYILNLQNSDNINNFEVKPTIQN
ncbi:hypothetical protein IKS57_06430 [bacterium]|nr:hypothetical protein [bacterium]